VTVVAIVIVGTLIMLEIIAKEVNVEGRDEAEGEKGAKRRWIGGAVGKGT